MSAYLDPARRATLVTKLARRELFVGLSIGSEATKQRRSTWSLQKFAGDRRCGLQETYYSKALTHALGAPNRHLSMSRICQCRVWSDR